MFKDVEFTIFDLEWATRKNKNSYIIEIGAVKVKNGKIIDKFDTLLKYTKSLSPAVSSLTGITNQMLLYGKDREETLFEFFLFIENSVLVAHDINNDIKVLKEEAFRLGLEVENLQICSLKLSQKIFLVERYNLQFLANFLNIKTLKLHRAYKDSYILFEIFQKILKSLPENIVSPQDIKNLNIGRKKLITHKIETVELNKDLAYTGFFDGASAGNPGKMGIGFVIISEKNETVCEGAEYIGVGTNNESEYQALISLLKFSVQNGIKNIAIFGDSNLVVKQVLGEWQVKAENLKPFAKEAQNLYKKIPNASLKWIKRDDNKIADALSKKGVDAG